MGLINYVKPDLHKLFLAEKRQLLTSNSKPSPAICPNCGRAWRWLAAPSCPACGQRLQVDHEED